MLEISSKSQILKRLLSHIRNFAAVNQLHTEYKAKPQSGYLNFYLIGLKRYWLGVKSVILWMHCLVSRRAPFQDLCCSFVTSMTYPTPLKAKLECTLMILQFIALLILQMTVFNFRGTCQSQKNDPKYIRWNNNPLKCEFLITNKMSPLKFTNHINDAPIKEVSIQELQQITNSLGRNIIIKS